MDQQIAPILYLQFWNATWKQRSSSLRSQVTAAYDIPYRGFSITQIPITFISSIDAIGMQWTTRCFLAEGPGSIESGHTHIARDTIPWFGKLPFYNGCHSSPLSDKLTLARHHIRQQKRPPGSYRWVLAMYASDGEIEPQLGERRVFKEIFRGCNPTSRYWHCNEKIEREWRTWE